MKKRITTITLIWISLAMFAQVEKTSELYKVLKVNDSIIFDASFNTCNLKQLSALINDDFEFYHDKAGLMEGKDTFIENTKNGLCKNIHTNRRELKKGTLEVFALKDTKGELYAAIQKGVHDFYENDRKGSTAKFTHLWVLKNEEWKLKRVLSYDHKQPTVKISKEEIIISANVLMTYVGEYEAPKTGKVTILMKNNSLRMNAGKMEITIFPESRTVFFSKEQPLTFEFVKDSKGNVIKMKVFENNKMVEEAKKVK